MMTKIDDDQNYNIEYNIEIKVQYSIESYLIRTVETLKKSTANKGTKILLLKN